MKTGIRRQATGKQENEGRAHDLGKRRGGEGETERLRDEEESR